MIDDQTAPLSGLRVLEVAQLVSGPMCGTWLGQLGADVTKIEPLSGDMARQFGPFVDGESVYFHAVNRGKKVVNLPLSTADGQEALRRYLAAADVLIYNMSDRAARRLGLDPEQLHRDHPDLIVCAISAYGSLEQSAGRVGVDLVFQAESGMMQVTGKPGDGPVRTGTNVPDFFAALSAMSGILAALQARRSGGAGRTVRVSLLRAAVNLQTCWLAAHSAGMPTQKLGNGSPFSAPTGTYSASDRDLVVSVVNDDQWQRLCEVLGEPGLAKEPKYFTNADRCANRSELDAALAPLFGSRTAAEWTAVLGSHGIPAGRALDYDEVLADWPQLFEWNDRVAVPLPPFELA